MCISMILQHGVPLSTLPKLKRRISTHQMEYVATKSGTTILYNLAFSISSRGPMSDTRLPPNRKGSDTDLYDEMCEKYIRVHRVNESSTIAMCFVPENIVALRGRGNDEEGGLEEKRTRRISGADGNEHVQRLVEEYAAFM